ncbi:hypothetical protein KIN20_026167 [Parelaphostrongylus tenuis]|uniref:Uncharacterized protein n=1 Tax=Parelaphostrongylus tenuis TaxID=148309 RepID=A0AAD5NDN2_PARTN|nr:hypothetical protein KIN20_026167 [Parelaphostrongylus tenuis]
MFGLRALPVHLCSFFSRSTAIKDESFADQQLAFVEGMYAYPYADRHEVAHHALKCCRADAHFTD